MRSNAASAANLYDRAREIYAGVGVDTGRAIETVLATPISMPCWQGDDVGGFEPSGAAVDGGGIQATGDYPGRARNPGQLRADLLPASAS